MNWLAHIFLSENSIDYQLGNLLADPLKGKSWHGASRELQNGFRMHAKIDTFTDASEYVSTSKSRLGEKGYLKGVIVDIVYDHFLLKNWERFSKISLDLFIHSFYQNAGEAIESYPGRAKNFVNNLVYSGCLTSYDSFSGLELAFRRLDRRLSERILAKEKATDYVPLLEDALENMEQDFLQFFPEMIEYFKASTNSRLEGHWFKS